MKTADYERVLAEVSKVYWELTNGKLSKPNYDAVVILDEVRLQQEKDIEETLAEHDKEIISLIDGLIDENLEYAPNDFNRGYTSSLTELKEKIGEI